MERTILHCDCNGFFASVECMLRPELREVPMAVCGDPDSRHGIILAKNEPAKAYGIHTAETIWQAKRKCPQLILAAPRFREYQLVSRRINEIYRRFTDLVEPFSIDESWLDVTGSRALFGSGEEIANTLRETVRSEIGITISVGVSFNKIFAKLGSDYKKPDATTVISRENYRDIVWPLPTDTLMFCGKKAAQTLAGLGIHTIGDMAGSGPEFLSSRLGKMGLQLYEYANGRDDSPVSDGRTMRGVKSVGNSVTFRRDLSGPEDVHKAVQALADSVSSRMRGQKLKCWVVQVGIKDPSFRYITRQKTLAAPTHRSRLLAAAGEELIKACWNPGVPIRMLSLSGSGLVPNDAPGGQLCFFGGESGADEEREERLETAMDSIRGRFGSGAVTFGGLLKEDIGLDGLHRK
ncbi:DNA polymerase IV [Caproiciproducens sp. NJN-50]|uniref:DNA polymerase IV n=1 Tax=Caproiciproducens sp. NJN-50 TaxID=2507162 RepID=UPI000FFE2566|nr:DNA polymerase IV [Caproiciproducens sp. NJN-50]QAT49022.1 DNA polymerase IV [Caproiciproducens sp. NJN-50]